MYYMYNHQKRTTNMRVNTLKLYKNKLKLINMKHVPVHIKIYIKQIKASYKTSSWINGFQGSCENNLYIQVIFLTQGPYLTLFHEAMLLINGTQDHKYLIESASDLRAMYLLFFFFAFILLSTFVSFLQKTNQWKFIQFPSFNSLNAKFPNWHVPLTVKLIAAVLEGGIQLPGNRTTELCWCQAEVLSRKIMTST